MGKVKVTDTTLQDAKIIEPQVFGDNRGFFSETWSDRDLKEAGVTIDFVQDNHSHSGVNVLRGLHFQRGAASQTKLVRVTRGVVYDVIVDMRVGSPTFGKCEGFILSEANQRPLLCPKGFAHGFCTLTDDVDFMYKVDEYYTPGAEAGVMFDEPTLNVVWPISPDKAVMSEKDHHNFTFEEAVKEAGFVYGEI
jgi:dTDP-4-dehydrorhamnose 3,5-epimerase